MVGEAGKEAVIPLENNTGWMDNMAAKVASMIGGSGGNGSQPINVVVKIGEDTIMEYFIDAMNRESILRGDPIIPV